MATGWSGWYWHLAGASFIAIGYVFTSSGDCALAQIIPDSTLGAESSMVTPNVGINGVPSDQIDGGAIRGANLFHSFREFNINAERGAYFTNPAAIQNILSRVTGNDPSDILGTLGVLGNANLFLINPNGIIFGENASLDVGGSFVGTTANAIGFGNQGFFSASAPDAPPLLTVNPSAFLFNQITAASIENRSRADAGSDPTGDSGYFGLRVPDGRSLLLVGGDLKANGGGIVAFGGRVDLAAVAGAGTVGLNVNDNNLSLSVPDSIPRANVSLTNEAGFIAAAGGNGNIVITAKNINLSEESGLYAGILSNLGSVDAQAGDITLNATESVSLDNSFIVNNVFDNAVGNSGGINITTGSLSATNVSQIQSLTSGQGNAGNITIVARDTVSFDGRDETDSFASAAFTSVEPGAVGNGGNINITTGSLLVTNRAQLVSNTEGTGNAGNIFVEARDQVLLSNSIIISEVTEETGVGNGGDINIKTGSLLLKDGSALLADLENRGNAGNIKIEARDAVILEGEGPSARSRSFLRGDIVPNQITATVEPQAVGNGGNIDISAKLLSVTDDGFIRPSTFGQGDAGNLSITTESLSLSNGALLSANTSGPGNAGNLTIAAQRLNVRDGAEVNVSSAGAGAAGNLAVSAGSIGLDNSSNLRATTRAGNQGNIFLRSGDLVLRRGSNITTNATDTATGGNITIDTGVLAALENSNITANAIQGQGGNIQIDTQRIFRSPDSDITASSELGIEGTVEINNPDVDPSQGLVTLPAELVDITGLIATGCPAGVIAGESRFIITGRGGLPPNPNEPLTGDNVLTDWNTLDSDTENRSSATPSTNSTRVSPPNQIVEANGWMINDKGEVVLTAQAPIDTFDIPWVPDSDCNAPEPES